MFDQNDQSQQTQDNTVVPEPVTDATAPADASTTAPVADPAITSAPLPAAAPSVEPDATAPTFNTSVLETPSQPTEDATSADTASPSIDAIASDAVSSLQKDDTTSAPSDGGDLLSIKQEALQNLSPLLGQLDQTPEEKFRTTMMLIQASDNQSLIQSAYAAAKSIEDEKVRAQALLDIVNEINYFTQHKPEPTDSPAS